MPTQFTLSGIVLDQGTKTGLSNAIVKLKTPNKVLPTVTDQDGQFTFPPIEEPTLPDGENTYQLLLYAYSQEGRQQESAPLIIDINKGEESRYVEVNMVNKGPVSNWAGKIFLTSLIIALVALAFIYYKWHAPKNDKTEVNTEIVNTLSEGLVNRITADSARISAFQLDEDNLIDSTDHAFLVAEHQQIQEAARELFTASQLDSSFQALISRNIEDVEQAINNKDKAALQAALINTRKYISDVPNFNPSWFWRTVPNSYYEILLWALFATLLRLIGNTSYFVSRNIFLRDSIFHKAALLFTIPLIALLITFVISFFKIAVFVGDVQLEVDFSDPFVSIILASLIGLAPWGAWEFMYGLADRLFDELKKWLGISKPGDVESEGGNKKAGQNNSVDPIKPKNDLPPASASRSISNPDDSADTDDTKKPTDTDGQDGSDTQ